MKPLSFTMIFLLLMLIFADCSKESSKTGVLKFKTSNPLVSGQKATNQSAIYGMGADNPPLTGQTTACRTVSLRLTVGDVWISKGEVKVGQPDNLEWVRVTKSTNTQAKLFEDISFDEVELPEGTYKSIKITFKNIFYRYCTLVSNPLVTYEFLETMGSYSATCDPNDQSWAKTNYFGPEGNHYLGADGKFAMAAQGEKVAPVVVESGKVAVVTWRMGAGATVPCTTYIIDANNNRQWDCGTDSMDFECPPEVKYMWDFIFAYQ